VADIEKWTDETVLAFSAMGGTRINDAASGWLRAAAMLEGAAAPTASLAAARANAGVAHLIGGDVGEARRAFRKAEQDWSDVVADIARLDVPMTGATSFHFRLATMVPGALLEARRHRYRQLAEGALAITRFNLLLADAADLTSELVMTQTRVLASTLKGVLGSKSPEVRLLALPDDETAGTASVFSIYAAKAVDFADRQRTLSSALSDDCATLEAAVALTALLGPQVFHEVRRQRQAEEIPSEI